MIHHLPTGDLYTFDRSRLECAAECARKYYWMYGFMGIGIVRHRVIPPYWPYITGSFIHEGIERVLQGMDGKTAADLVATQYADDYNWMFSEPDIDPERLALLELELNQEITLAQALVYGWSLIGYPRLMANYSPVEGGIEQEEAITWEMDDNDGRPKYQMRMLTRTDVLAINNQSKLAILFNLKSVGEANEKWRFSFSRDMQTLTEAMAVEARLGVKVDGVIIEGLVKGKRNEWPKGSGFWQYNNSLIYAWVKDSTEISLPGEQGGLQFEASWDYTCTAPHVMGNGKRCNGNANHTLGKGFRKRLVNDLYPGGLYGWIDNLMRTDPSLLESYFLQLPPITRDEFQVERWKRQKLHAERDRQDKAELVDSNFIRGDKAGAYLWLDHYFNMNEGYQCNGCMYENICWGSDDPFDETKFKPRVPNHLAEVEGLVSITVEGNK